MGGNAGWNERAIHGLGLTGVALYAHRIYVNRHFVDPWRFGAGLADRPVECGVVDADHLDGGVPVWGSLLLACSSLSMALTVHRQSSTSGINFVRALAALAIGLNPSNWGLILGLAAMRSTCARAF